MPMPGRWCLDIKTDNHGPEIFRHVKILLNFVYFDDCRGHGKSIYYRNIKHGCPPPILRWRALHYSQGGAAEVTAGRKKYQ